MTLPGTRSRSENEREDRRRRRRADGGGDRAGLRAGRARGAAVRPRRGAPGGGAGPARHGCSTAASPRGVYKDEDKPLALAAHRHDRARSTRSPTAISSPRRCSRTRRSRPRPTARSTRSASPPASSPATPRRSRSRPSPSYVGEARRPNFIGTHYFSPASRMKLVEVIPAFDTAPATRRDRDAAHARGRQDADPGQGRRRLRGQPHVPRLSQRGGAAGRGGRGDARRTSTPPASSASATRWVRSS